jgi:hypothetical protein
MSPAGECAGDNILYRQKRRVDFLVEKVMSMARQSLDQSKIMFGHIESILRYPV